ncbi:MAG: hypothetical protein GY679_04680 [Mycoplasma sp.]|nr:hypothetical protein [Mycoplasma sp.]
MSNPTFRPMASNSDRFIWEEDPNLLQTDNNRLKDDYDYPNRYPDKIYKLVNIGDNDWWQFRTTYALVVTELYNCDGIVSTMTNTLIRAEDNWNYYQVDFDTSNLTDGYYYKRHSMETDPPQDGVVFPIAHFRSDWFYVAKDNPYTMLIEWYGSGPNEIPMQWELNGGLTQQLRIRADIRQYTAGNMLSTMVGSDNNIVTLVSDPVNGRMLNIENLTEYMSKKMNIAVSHEQFWVNGQEFKTDEPIDVGEPLGNTMTYSFKVKLQETNYLNYASDPILTGIAPVIPVTAIKAANGFAIKASDGKALRVT